MEEEQAQKIQNTTILGLRGVQSFHVARFMFISLEVQFSELANPNPNCLNPKSVERNSVGHREVNLRRTGRIPFNHHCSGGAFRPADPFGSSWDVTPRMLQFLCYRR